MRAEAGVGGNVQRIRNRLYGATPEAPKSAPLPRKVYPSSTKAERAEFVYLSKEDLTASSADVRNVRGESTGSSDNYRELRDIVDRIERRRLDWERGHRERGRRLRQAGVVRGKSFNGEALANSKPSPADKARKKMYFDRVAHNRPNG